MRTTTMHSASTEGQNYSFTSTPKQSSKVPKQSDDVDEERRPVYWRSWTAVVIATLFFCFSFWSLSKLNRTYLSTPGSQGRLPADLSSLTSRGKTAVTTAKPPEAHLKQEGIPKFIHQTFKSSDVPIELQSYVDSWTRQNPDWTYRLYNDSDCLDFVRTEFPQYLEAYQSLPKNVERSDFFRYLIVYRYGGVYADLDTECKVPMDDVLKPTDGLVVGYECDVASKETAVKRHFVRQRQILQWVFAAVPGHPVLRDVCESIAENALAEFPDLSSNHNTLEKTGPGIWTDTVLKHTLMSNHSIRILPQVAFGVHPSGTDELDPESGGILVQHYFSGSWKSRNWGDRNLLTLKFFKNETKDVIKPSVVPYFPVEADFSPPFTVYVHPSGSGPTVGTSDVGAEITRRGSWQAGDPVPRSPRVVDVVAGSLGHTHMHLHLLDIGAGLGFFSLAAAARQHPVIALETEAISLGPFRRSILANNFKDGVALFTSVEEFTHAMHPSCRTPNTASIILREKNFSQAQDKRQLECNLEVGALRVGHSGWSSWRAIRGSRYFHRFEPEIVLLEFSPWVMKRAGLDPMAVLEDLVHLDYAEIYHAGRLCNRRWHILSKHVAELNAEDAAAWCHLSPEHLNIFDRMEQTEREQPENILFVKRRSDDVS